MSKYRTIDWRPVIKRAEYTVYISTRETGWKDVHILFRMAMNNIGKLTAWTDALGNEYVALYDPLLMEMHTDLDEMHTNL